MRHFEILAGKHHTDGPNGKTYVKGQIVPSNIDLVLAFGKEKFREVSPSPAAQAAHDAIPAVKPLPPELDNTRISTGVSAPDSQHALATAKEAAEKEAANKGTTTEGPLGEDVTADFDSASEAEFKVFKKGSNYFITNPDEPGKALHDKPLTLRQVDGQVEKLLNKK